MSEPENGDSQQPKDRDPDPEELPSSDQRERYAQQIEMIIESLEQDAENLARHVKIGRFPDTDEIADTEFLYRQDTILTRDRDAERVSGILGLPFDGDKRNERLPDAINGLTVLLLGSTWTAPTALATIDGALGLGVATYDRVVHLCSSSACPATEPVPADSGPVPEVNSDRQLGMDVKVAVIDTGLPGNPAGETLPLTHWDWLSNGVTGGAEDAAHVGHYKGHGLFVAGVLRATAPSARVHVHPFIFTGGGQIESDLAPRLVEAFQTHPDIISMSAGTRVASSSSTSATKPSAATQPLLTFEVFLTHYLEGSKTLLVCAAGNDGDQGPFEPASLGWPVAVGALAGDGGRAWYSNYGGWVDVFALGGHVNAYPNGPYTYREHPKKGKHAQFSDHLASWSGTSFATPFVAGLVAARMSWTGESAPQAWSELWAHAAVSGGMRTLRPGDADRGVNPPSGWTP
jgi:subtilisin family serine protease